MIQTATRLYSNVTLFLTIAAGVFLGYFFTEPFLESGMLEWFSEQDLAVKQIVDVGGRIEGAIISAFFPMLILWAVAFYLYPLTKNHPVINGVRVH